MRQKLTAYRTWQIKFCLVRWWVFGSTSTHATLFMADKELCALYSSPNIIRVIKPKTTKISRPCSMYGEEESCIQGFGGEIWGKTPLGRPTRKWEDNIKMDPQGVVCGAWTGSDWLRIEKSGGLLWVRWWTFGFHKMRWISWVAEDLLASQERLCST